MKKCLKLLLAAMLAITLTACDNSGGVATIKTQPQDVVVSYPEGASFTVEVDHPRNVESYQWIMVDIVGNEFVLEGSSAKTKTLVIPSTEQNVNALGFYCRIADKAGNVIDSEPGYLSEDNAEEGKPVLYVGEFAIEPGESLDLSKIDLVDGHKPGSGKVSFDANGADIVFDNVDFDNTYTKAGIVLQPNVGISLYCNMPETKEFNVTFIGENKIMNTYFDEDYNAAGIPLDFCFTGETEMPLVNLVGDGSLTVTNGTYAIRNTGDLLIDIDINIKQTRENYGDGIVAANIKVCEGKTLDLEVYGSAVMASGNLYLDGADVTINAHTPHISMGVVTKDILHAEYMMVIDHSNVDIRSYADQEISPSVMMLTALLSNGDMYIQNESRIAYSVDVKQGTSIYTSNYQGIIAANLDIENSDVDIVIDSPYVFSSFGIYADGFVQLTNSKFNADIHTTGVVYGVAPEGDFNADNSEVTVNVSAYDTYEVHQANGIMCENAVFRFDDSGKKVTIHAEDGIALGCNLGQIDGTPGKYTANYQTKNVYLREGAACLSPEGAVVSTGAVERNDGDFVSYIHIETYYDRNDTSKPASDLVFGQQ
ncbi:MAG: hypothetical protein IKE38_06075 [Erysipelotrichaceae bacterium]|nr:hypothetical protein [Erysipelotrichaceae bacterium]